ncbi:MAG TPA: cation:proton antiporter [Chthoniobacterales bacterium]
MPHNIDLILFLAAGLTGALLLGFITQKLRLSPIVGYLLAGVLVGPFTPGFVADNEIASQCAEIGVILLMFGVGLHFHLKDLIAVWKVAVPGAIVQIAAAALLGAAVTRVFGWTWTAGIVFGMAISVASTVVLTRVLADNRDLHSPSGHIAIGWLIVEDLFTIVVLVFLPALFGGDTHGAEHASDSNSPVWVTVGLALVKLLLLVVVALFVGQKWIPKVLGYVARTGSRDLFTLTILVLALGIAVSSAKFFGASMALGAFLAGMIVGQSEFSARAASDALPMRDAFAVLFFVSVGMLFDPSAVPTGWPLMLATLGIVLIGKPVAALLVVLLFRRPFKQALSIAVALAQIGEFSFILAALGTSLKILPPEATNALVVTSVLSITLNPMLYKCVGPVSKWLENKGLFRDTRPARDSIAIPEKDEAAHRVVVVGYGPIGQTLGRILRDTGIQIVVIEMNLDTVRKLRAEGQLAVYGDAAQREILHHAGIESAEGLIIAASGVNAGEIIRAARDLNPNIRILTRATYLRETEALKQAGAGAVFSSEGEIALSMTSFIMQQLGATDEQIDNERNRVREELF